MWWSLLSKPINVCSRQRVSQFETVLDIGLGRIWEFDQDRCCVLTDFRVTWVPCKTAADVLLRHRQIRHTFTNMHSMLLVNGDPTTGSQQQSIKYLVPILVDIFLWYEKSQSCSGLGLHMSWSPFWRQHEFRLPKLSWCLWARCHYYDCLGIICLQNCCSCCELQGEASCFLHTVCLVMCGYSWTSRIEDFELRIIVIYDSKVGLFWIEKSLHVSAKEPWNQNVELIFIWYCKPVTWRGLILRELTALFHNLQSFMTKFHWRVLQTPATFAYLALKLHI